MVNLAQFVSIKVQSKVDTQLAKVREQIEWQDLVAIRVREYSDKALKLPALIADLL